MGSGKATILVRAYGTQIIFGENSFIHVAALSVTRNTTRVLFPI